MFSASQLKAYRLAQNLSQTVIAKELGITRSAFSAWETGKTIPNKKHREALAKILHVNSQDFEEEHPHLTLYKQLTEPNQKKVDDLTHDLLLEQKLTYLFPITVIKDVALSAGPGQGFYDELETETVYSDKEYGNYDIATWIEGTSMSPKYLDGEVALIRETGFDYDGAVYALVWEGRAYIKKLYRERDGLRMVSINKQGNPDRFISQDDEFHIVGKVVGHFMPVEEY